MCKLAGVGPSNALGAWQGEESLMLGSIFSIHTPLSYIPRAELCREVWGGRQVGSWDSVLRLTLSSFWRTAPEDGTNGRMAPGYWCLPRWSFSHRSWQLDSFTHYSSRLSSRWGLATVQYLQHVQRSHFQSRVSTSLGNLGMVSMTLQTDL